MTYQPICSQLLQCRNPTEPIDKVLAEDPETGRQGYFEVVALTNHPAGEILKVTIDAGADQPGSRNSATTPLDTLAEHPDNEEDQLNSDAGDDHSTPQPAGSSTHMEIMEVTPAHPMYVEGAGWVWAENLTIGDRLRRADGGWAKVLAVERVELETPQRVYNFTVKGPHTYFVLEVGVLVHNARCDLPPENEWNWAPHGPNGPNHSRNLQRAFIRGLDDNQVIAVRPMDWGVWSWERLKIDIPFKPMAAVETLYPHTKAIKKKVAGFRTTNAGHFLADADVAWAIKFDEGLGNYLLIDNDVFHNVYRQRIRDEFTALGHKNSPVLHGPHMNVELMFREQGKTAEDFGGHDLKFFRDYYKDRVYIYGRNYQGQTGYLGFGGMEETLNSYAPNWRNLSDGGQQIRAYDPPANPWLDRETRDQIRQVLDHLEQHGRFPKTLR